jgi:hypothetical protein
MSELFHPFEGTIIKLNTTSTNAVSRDPSSPTPSTSPVRKTPENTYKDPNEPEPVAEGDIQIHYSSD